MSAIKEGQRSEEGLSKALVARTGEMAVSASAARAKALVEAQYLVAINRPRNIMDARAKILDACKRDRFAESAIYAKPVAGNTVRGPSIRFAETAVQAMGNITVNTTQVFEDDDRITVNIQVTDLEGNLTYGKDVTLSKTVERSSLKKGQKAISQRENSSGKVTYRVEATEDDMANKLASAESKIIRNCGLRLIPQDIVEEAMDACWETIEKGGADPAASQKKISDGFAGLGIKPSELEAYLGHPLAQWTTKEYLDLRGIYQCIKDGEATWASYMAQKAGARTEPEKGTIDMSAIRPGDPETHTEPGDPMVATGEQATIFPNEQSAAMVIDAFFMYLDEQDVSDAGKIYAKELICKRFKVAKLNKIPDTKALEVDEYISGIVKAEMQRESFLPMPRA